eukprot:1149683-Pelagomonas_calceolata.AAC.12
MQVLSADEVECAHAAGLMFTVVPADMLAFGLCEQVLSADEVQRARAASLMWTADFKYPMLPWSSIVLEAVPESETHSLRV